MSMKSQTEFIEWPKHRQLKERGYEKTRNGSKKIWLIKKKMFEFWTMMKPQ